MYIYHCVQVLQLFCVSVTLLLPCIADDLIDLFVWLLLYAHRHQSILGAADTSEQVDDYGTQNMDTFQSGFRTSDLTITDPTR
jgi:hypothetical protein